MANIFSKIFKAVINMVRRDKPEQKGTRATPTPTGGPSPRPSRGEDVEIEIPRAVRNREFDRWDRFEEEFDDVETLGESEYNETI